MDFEATGTNMKMQLSKLDEWHEKAYHNTKIYKERTFGGLYQLNPIAN
jgi:hypothetical protein